MAFLCSCQTYIRLCPDSFSNNQTKIVWALSYMKTGRVEKWAAWVFHWEKENPNSYRFIDWENFCWEFKEEFCPSHTDIAAITCLESTAYFQNKCSINEYIDKFLDLVSKAGYTDIAFQSPVLRTRKNQNWTRPKLVLENCFSVLWPQ